MGLRNKTVLPYAVWEDDCQGKKDFDGPILSVSSRYWPGPMTVYDSKAPERGLHEVPGGKPSAYSSIILRLGPKVDHDGGGDYCTWSEQWFESETESDVKKQVEDWVSSQMKLIIGLLGTSAFKPTIQI